MAFVIDTFVKFCDTKIGSIWQTKKHSNTAHGQVFEASAYCVKVAIQFWTVLRDRLGQFELSRSVKKWNHKIKFQLTRFTTFRFFPQNREHKKTRMELKNCEGTFKHLSELGSRKLKEKIYGTAVACTAWDRLHGWLNHVALRWYGC